MGGAQALHPGAGGDDAGAGHFADALLLQPFGRRGHAVARGQHRIEKKDMGVARPRRQPEVVADRLEGFLIAEEADVSDRRGGKHVEDAVGHGQAGAEDGHEHEGASRPRAGGAGQRRLDLPGQNLEIAQRLVGHQLRKLLQKPAEFRRRCGFVPQRGDFQFGQGVPHVVETSDGLLGHAARSIALPGVPRQPALRLVLTRIRATIPRLMKIRRALLSVTDKTGLVDFARGLAADGVEILSTGGTAAALREAGLPVKDVSEHTGFPEMLDGRVKTLHPMIHGGLLFRRDLPSHAEQAEAHGIAPIDLVAVNLYAFEETVAREGVTRGEAIENIDIGGPSMLRSAAKNHAAVTVVCDPADYDEVLREMGENKGETSSALRERLAAKVFDLTARYDRAIADYLGRDGSGAPACRISLPLAASLRYGENPHQKAELYGSFSEHLEQLHGKELSYNNILDITAAADLIAEFDEPTVAILKHTNPCGVGSGADLLAAWDKAFATDRQAPFGGIIICNRTLTAPLAGAIAEIFSEVIIAPDFEAAALGMLRKKKNLRLMKMRGRPSPAPRDVRSVVGGVLVQDHDADGDDFSGAKAVTRRAPSPAERRAMEFGWKVVKHVKSNAVVFAGPDRTLGIGAGQMSRVDSVRIAVWKAGEAGLSLAGSAVASDAFFPFPDGLVSAAEAGATAAIQPGGSVRDAEVIEAADGRGLAMVFTGKRHFRH